MRRCIILLYFLNFLFLVGRSQSALQCEYWIDNDYNSKKESLANDTVVTFDIDVQRPGLHYLNFRSCFSDGK